MKDNLVCGVDFGTSNSAVSIARNNQILIVGSKVGEKKTMPSLIYFEDWNKYVVGNLAIEQYLKKKGKGRLIQSVKTFLPDSSFTQTYVYGRSYTLEDFVAIILSELKTKAEKYIGRTIQNVILGRP